MAASTYHFDYNPNIACEFKDLDKGKDMNLKIKITWWNIANAKRDEDMNPLADRLGFIIDEISALQTDVLILLEAGRPSKDLTWTEIAGKIEKGTGLTYLGIQRINATPMSFGKAVFYNLNTVVTNMFTQEWTSRKYGKWSGDHFGNDIIFFDVHPVIDQKVIINKHFRVAAAHLPMKLEARLQVSKWVRHNAGRSFDIIGGDFNTFKDDGGPKMITSITTCSNLTTDDSLTLQEMLPQDTKFTFRAFSHDVVDVPNERLKYIGKHSAVVEEGPETSKVLFSSWLDHIFATKRFIGKIGKESIMTQIGKITSASDHAPISLTILDWRNL